MRRLILHRFVTALSAAVLVSSSVVLIAGQQAPAAPVFTTQQAAAGKVAYDKSCASCHMPDLSGDNDIPALAGIAFKSAWGARSTKELFDYMAATMPFGDPSLDPETYASITAFILQSNGAVAGKLALSASTAARIGSLTTASGAPPAVSTPTDRANTAVDAAPSGKGADSGAPAPE